MVPECRGSAHPWGDLQKRPSIPRVKWWIRLDQRLWESDVVIGAAGSFAGLAPGDRAGAAGSGIVSPMTSCSPKKGFLSSSFFSEKT
jgi:hypothetical protein